MQAGGEHGSVGSALVAAGLAPADPDAFWNIVHNQCFPDEEQHGRPDPCARVELSNGERNGYVVLKDLVGATQFPFIPNNNQRGPNHAVHAGSAARLGNRHCISGSSRPGRRQWSGYVL